MPPINKINYMLRPNKTVERKLIVETVAALKPHFDLTAYRYIGFGSMWFVDFILMHKYLQISEMFSIENPDNAKRADFNRPYGCITVMDAESSEALPCLDLNDNRDIIWLDYEDGLDGPALNDIKTVCESARSGTVLIVTVNASLERLKIMYRQDEQGQRMRPKDILPRLARDLVPQTLPRYALQQKKGFPKFCAELLFIQAKRARRIVGEKEQFWLIRQVRTWSDVWRKS